MKFTMNDCMGRINQALNYPSIEHSDVSHFFDQAIAELNTSLRIALPAVTEMLLDNTFNILDTGAVVALDKTPGSADRLAHYATEDDLPKITEDHAGVPDCAYVCKHYSNKKYYIRHDAVWKRVDKLYGICNSDGKPATYVAVPINTSVAVWLPTPAESVSDFSLTEYLPLDWWILFIIPYVCFKFAVRNGDSGELFRDEFTQGFQQLQTSYTVPNTVKLYTVAGRLAYKNDVETYASNLNTDVPTRAIYAYMRLKDSTLPIHGGFYEAGGWGV